jgi:hypothetical protein
MNTVTSLLVSHPGQRTFSCSFSLVSLIPPASAQEFTPQSYPCTVFLALRDAISGMDPNDLSSPHFNLSFRPTWRIRSTYHHERIAKLQHAQHRLCPSTYACTHGWHRRGWVFLFPPWSGDDLEILSSPIGVVAFVLIAAMTFHWIQRRRLCRRQALGNARAQADTAQAAAAASTMNTTEIMNDK